MPGPDIEITNEQRWVRFSSARVVKLLEYVLKQERSKATSVSVLVTDDKRIAKLHKVYLGDPAPTDVISFGLPKGAPEARKGYLGDVVVSAETAKRAAPEFGQTAAHELERYCVHGTLHLLGYDDHDPAERRAMHTVQEKYLNAFDRAAAKSGTRGTRGKR